MPRCAATSAITASSGSRKARRTTAGRRPKAALTRDLSEDLQDAWERLRETAAAFGDQRIYASHKSIMFSRKSCYFFVRPKKKFLEVCVFLGRAAEGPAGPAGRPLVEVQGRSHHSHQAPRRGGGAASPTGFGKRTTSTIGCRQGRRPRASRRVDQSRKENRGRKRRRRPRRSGSAWRRWCGRAGRRGATGRGSGSGSGRRRSRRGRRSRGRAG